jgi:protease-4
LGRGITLPFLDVQIPDRDLNDEEQRRVKRLILKFYDQFVEKVAKGRDLETVYVDSVGQGRVYLGRRGIELKLVDRIGGLDDALTLAKERAGLSPNRYVEIVEYPKRKFVNFDALFKSSGPFSWLTKNKIENSADYELEVLRRMNRQSGELLFMLPPEYILE